MAQLDVQRALAHLYRRADTRSRVRDGDRSALLDFGLSDEEFRGLRTLLLQRSDGVEQLAVTLRRKRRERLTDFYPSLTRLLGPKRWRTLTDDYCEDRRAPAGANLAADPAAFGRHLRDVLGAEIDEEPPVRDLFWLEWQKAEVAATPVSPSSTESGVTVHDSRPLLPADTRLGFLTRSPAELRNWVERGAPRPIAVDVSPTHVLLYRRAAEQTTRVAVLVPSLAAALARADGRTTIRELALPLGPPSEHDAITSGLSAAIERLAAAGAVILVRTS